VLSIIVSRDPDLELADTEVRKQLLLLFLLSTLPRDATTRYLDLFHKTEQQSSLQEGIDAHEENQKNLVSKKKQSLDEGGYAGAHHA
jgi:hypothetical protein